MHRWKPVRFWSLLILCPSLAACGYFKAGSWLDDPKNWERAFDTRVPSDTTVLHSSYTRYPHWTYEETYYFKATIGHTTFGQLTAGLRKVSDDEVPAARGSVYSTAPDWFAPEAADQYEAWVHPSAFANFVVFRDRVTGAVYVFGSQL